MKKIYIFLFALISITSNAQSLLRWNTFGNTGNETTEPSVFNDANIASADLNFTGSGVMPANNGNRFGGTPWGTSSIDLGKYIQFTVTPNAGFTFTPTSFVFYWDRSNSGPSSVALRSSADGYMADIGSLTMLSTSGSSTTTSRTISISGLTNITVATTFRLYGYGASATTGTGGFDCATSINNVVLNGSTAAACAPGTWTGTTDTDWNTATNWCGGVPTSSSNVIIPSGLTNYPILNSNVTIENLNMSGPVTLGSNNLTVNNPLTGTFDATSHIITNGTGGLILPVTATAATYDFPVGSTTDYKPAKIEFTAAPTAAGTLTGRWLQGVGGATAIGTAGLPLTEATIPGGSANISTVNFSGIWNVSAGGGLIDGTYTATFTGNNSVGILNNTQTNLIKRDNSGANWTNPGTHITTTGTNVNPIVSRSGLMGFSEFGIGGTLTSLPIAVNTFTASKQNSNTNAINWKATCTGASVSFELQRSTNGIIFTPINTLTATQSRCAAPFNYVDNYNATSTITYYKLKVMSNTGEVKYSQITAINNKNAVVNTIALYPNITKGNAVLVVESKTTTNVNFVITNAKGAIIRRFTENLSEGANAYPIKISNLSVGSYQITGIIDGALKTIRFIKE